MSGISASERQRREEHDARMKRALTGPVASWQEMREAIGRAEEAIAYARVLATRRAEFFALDEARGMKRQMKSVACKAFGGSQVYVIKRKGASLVKIGVTGNLNRRLATLRTAAGADLELLVAFPGERGDEQRLHEQFARLRKQGEWFEYAPTLRRWVREKQLAGRKLG